MERFQVIAARFIILVTVILCYQQNALAQNHLITVCTECSDGNDRQQSCFISHMDPSADDPIPHTMAVDLYSQEIERIPATQEISIIPSPRLPIWQPPRIQPLS